MAQDHLEQERRTYRKSPGRRYGYDYQAAPNGREHVRRNAYPHTSYPGELSEATGQQSRRTSGLLAPRPDLRKSRQLQRQSILASKLRSQDLMEVEAQSMPDEELEFTYSHPLAPIYIDEDFNEQIEPEDGAYYESTYGVQNAQGRRGTRAFVVPEQQLSSAPGEEAGAWGPAGYEDEPEEPPAPKRRKATSKKRVSRRKLLFGLGALVVGGVATYELAPQLPGAISEVGANIEHQLQDAYNRGIAAGSEAVRKDFVTALNSLEGYSLQGAVAAARLTRQAYDTFVSPIVSVASTVAGDFLNVALQAVITARGWLSRIYQDNVTLAALQTILESWVKQVSAMPQSLQSITDADLDGAQAYLRALERKLQAEQAALNQQAKPTPAPKKSPKR